MSTYLPSIPQANDNLDFSQSQILGNFTSLDTVYGINHYKFSDSTANSGKHKFSMYPENPDPVPGGDEGALYTKVSPLSPLITELFWIGESPATPVQMTKGTPVIGSSGSTFLPGGIILKWVAVVINTFPQTIDFTTLGIGAFPNNIFTGYATINNNQVSLGGTSFVTVLNNFSNNTVDAYSNKLGTTQFFLFIGN